MSAQGLDDLLKVASLLETLPEGRFDYATWVGESWGGKADLSCGTTACALGWATTIPEFAARGLVLDDSGEVKLTFDDDDFGPAFGAYAAARFFGISIDESQYLFLPEECSEFTDSMNLPPSPRGSATAKDVAAHIRQFVAWKRGDS